MGLDQDSPILPRLDGLVREWTDGTFRRIDLDDSRTGYIAPSDIRAATGLNDLEIGKKIHLRVVEAHRDGVRVLMDSDPLVMALEKYPPGSIFERSISRIAEFGVFVEVEPGIPGLLHNASIPERLQDKFKIGDSIRVQVEEILMETRGFVLCLAAQQR